MDETTKLPELKQPTDIEGILKFAIQQNVPIEVMERLLAMRKELKAEAARDAFAAAMAEFQGIKPKIPKKYRVLNKDNTVRYRYAKLDDIAELIQEPLSKCGLSYKWEPSFTQEGSLQFIESTCIISHVDGHSERSSFKVPVDKTGAMTLIQFFGSASTYAKRYSLCDALGLSPDEDDDSQGETITIDTKIESQQSNVPPPNDALREVIDITTEEGISGKTGKPWTRYDIFFRGDNNKYSTFSESICKTAGEAMAKKLMVVADVKSTQAGKYVNWSIEHLDIAGSETKSEKLVKKLQEQELPI